MSNVFARNKNETDLQFMINALELQRELIKMVFRERVLPKKYRNTLGMSIINTAQELVDNLVYANNIYPKDELSLSSRCLYQETALANYYQLQNRLVTLTNCVETFKNEECAKYIEKIAHEMELIRGWIKSNNVKEDKINKNKDKK